MKCAPGRKRHPPSLCRFCDFRILCNGLSLAAERISASDARPKEPHGKHRILKSENY